MAEIGLDCPQCNHARTTFDVLHLRPADSHGVGNRVFEARCRCLSCGVDVVVRFRVSEGCGVGVTDDGGIVVQPSPSAPQAADCSIEGPASHISAASQEAVADQVDMILRQGDACLSAGSFAAAAALSRLSIDLATAQLLPPLGDENDVPSERVRQDLGLRLQWLIESGILPAVLADHLSTIDEHQDRLANGRVATEDEAISLLDFATLVFEVACAKRF